MMGAIRYLFGRGRRKAGVVVLVWVGLVLAIRSYKLSSQQFPIEIADGFIKRATRYAVMKLFRLKVVHDEDDNYCNGFESDPVDESIAKYFKRMPKSKCTNKYPSLLYATDDGNYLKVNWSKIARLKLPVDYCMCSSLRRYPGDDFKVTASKWSEKFTDSITIPEDMEHIWGRCFSGDKLVGNGYISLIRRNSTLETALQKSYTLHLERENPKETLSVLMIGIDGTSKHNFERAMPKTKDYLINSMGAIEMYKVNKVGYNTLPNIIPLLTGFNIRQLRKSWNDKKPFDVIDHLFILEEARLAGYRTSVILDATNVTAFHWLKKGWENPKFHFYNRPVVVNSEFDNLANTGGRTCVGDSDKISLFYDYWLQMTRRYNNSNSTPYFGFSFFATTTHNNVNMASSIDDLYLELFQKFAGQNSLNNTLIVFFSDHGSRFGQFRSTFRGMMEANNPFMFFIFPPWFESKYPKIMSNFRKNQNRLVTNFDVYATLKDVLHFKGDEIAPGDINKTRGLSLFQELPKKRTCQEAGIPMKYCNCRDFTTSGITSEMSEEISNTLLKAIVLQTQTLRDICVELTLKSVNSVFEVSSTSETEEFYQTTIQTSPSDAIYEAMLKREKNASQFSVVSDINMLTMYDKDADCTSDATLRYYCYCRSNLG